jgi:hypothetical protein
MKNRQATRVLLMKQNYGGVWASRAGQFSHGARPQKFQFRLSEFREAA